jgi:hypothetical protein
METLLLPELFGANHGSALSPRNIPKLFHPDHSFPTLLESIRSFDPVQPPNPVLFGPLFAGCPPSPKKLIAGRSNFAIFPVRFARGESGKN